MGGYDPYEARSPSYVLAFTPNLISALDCVVDKLGTPLSNAQIFLELYAPRNLYCYGNKLSGLKKKLGPNCKKIDKKYVDKLFGQKDDTYTKQILTNTKLTDKKIYERYHKHMKLYIDSGGFQCIMGYIHPNVIQDYMKAYSRFINNYHEYFDYAFSLDLPPNDMMFKSIKDAEEFNHLTYQGLIDHVRPHILSSKVIFVYHFTSPRIWNIWQSIQNNYADKYSSYWSAAGIAKKKTFQRCSAWLYTPVLMQFINKALNDPDKDDKIYQFHILGDFTPLSMLMSKIVCEFVRRLYNIKLYITYDASSVCTGNLVHRFLNTFDEKSCKWLTTSVTRDQKDKPNLYNKRLTNGQFYLKELQQFAEEVGFNNLPYDDIDDPKKDNFWTEVAHYTILYMVFQYFKLEQYCYDVASELVNLYQEGHEDMFSNAVYNTLVRFNAGNNTRYLSTKRSWAINTLEALADMKSCSKLDHKCYIHIQQLKDWNDFSQRELQTW